MSSFKMHITQNQRYTIIANHFIAAGTILCTEKALFTVNYDTFKDQVKQSDNIFIAYFQLLLKQYYELLNDDQFWSEIANIFENITQLPVLINLHMNEQLNKFITVVSLQDQKRFSKFVQVFYYKGYINKCSDSLFFRGTIPKLSHSCRPNCHLDFLPNTSICHVRVIRDIQIHDKITVNYKPELIYRPVYERNDILFQSEGFVCSCDRCNRHFDDTRQFNCLQSTCSGKHYFHQPVKSSIVKMTRCSMCNQAAPSSYAFQAKQWETNFPLFKYDMINQFREACAIFQSTKHTDALENILNFNCHYSHFLSARMSLEMIAFSADYLSLLELTKRYIQPFLNTALFPNHEAVNAMFSASKFFYFSYQRLKKVTEYFTDDIQKSVACEALWLSQQFFQSAMRDFKLLSGRDIVSFTIRENKDNFLQILRLLPPAPNDVYFCAFCADSPNNTKSLVLKRCGKCHETSYCGKACQIIHWPIHKQQCSNSHSK